MNIKTIIIIILCLNQNEILIWNLILILYQNFNNSYEIIIGDDGSTEESIEVINNFSEKYPDKINYFIMERDKNITPVPYFRVSIIFFKAFQMAEGEYLTFLSGDDFFLI